MKLYRFKRFRWRKDFVSNHICKTVFAKLFVIEKFGGGSCWHAEYGGQVYDSDVVYDTIQEAKAAAEKWLKDRVVTMLKEVMVDGKGRGAV